MRGVYCLIVFLLLPAAALAQARPSFAPEDEQEIVRLVNQERQSRGIATLIYDEHLQEAARKHSQRMAATGEVEHEFADEPKLMLRLGAQELRFDISGENVALAAGAARAHTALMNSPGHRANILDPQYNTVGIGVVRTPQGIYVTEDFAHRLPQATVDEAEEQVVVSLNRLRRSAGAPILTRVSAPDLRRRACAMAAQDKLDPRAGLSSNVSNSVVFTAIDLNKVSASIERLKSSPASSFAVGACYQSSPKYESPVFWIIVVTYF